MQDLINTIQHMDCLTLLRQLPDESIDMILTSPPYDNLRDYKGYTWDFESIAKESYRVLKTGGVLVWVVGDATVNGSETLTSFRQALYFVDMCGFKMHDTMIYGKNGAIMNNHHPRYIDAFEYMFVMVKGENGPKAWNPVMRENVTAGQSSGAAKRQRSGELKTFGNTRTQTGEISLEWNIWRINSGMGQSATDTEAFEHPAIFPEELARRHIHTWSNEDDIILDFFSGSGTTAKVARKMNRNFIAGDSSLEYVELARRRLQNADPMQDSIFKDGTKQLSLFANINKD